MKKQVSPVAIIAAIAVAVLVLGWFGWKTLRGSQVETVERGASASRMGKMTYGSGQPARPGAGYGSGPGASAGYRSSYGGGRPGGGGPPGAGGPPSGMPGYAAGGGR